MKNDPNKSEPVCDGCGISDVSCRRSILWGNRNWCSHCFNAWYVEWFFAIRVGG